MQGALAEVKAESQLLRQKLEFFIKRYFGGTKNESLDPKLLQVLLVTSYTIGGFIRILPVVAIIVILLRVKSCDVGAGRISEATLLTRRG